MSTNQNTPGHPAPEPVPIRLIEKHKVIYAKRARGLMTRYAVVNRLTEPEGLKDFDYDGYAFEPSVSDEKSWVFRRRQD